MVGVLQLHEFAELPGVGHVVAGLLVPPGVGLGTLFVANAPVGNVEGVGVTMAAAQVGVVGIARAVTVLDPIAGLFGGAGGHIYHQEGLGANGPAVGNELGRTEVVVDLTAPDQVGPLGALLLRADAVLPVVNFGDRTSRKAQQRHVEPINQVKYVGAESGGVAQRESSA